MRTHRLLHLAALTAASCAFALLTACGGGSDNTDPPAPPTADVAHYAGDWMQSACPNEGTLRYGLRVTPRSGGAMDVRLMQIQYFGEGCSGFNQVLPLDVGRTDTVALKVPETADGLSFHRATRAGPGPSGGYHEAWALRPDGRLCSWIGGGADRQDDPLVTSTSAAVAARLTAMDATQCFVRLEASSGSGTPLTPGSGGARMFGLYAFTGVMDTPYGPRSACTNVDPATWDGALSLRDVDEFARGSSEFELLHHERRAAYPQADCGGAGALWPLADPAAASAAYQLAPMRMVAGLAVSPYTVAKDQSLRPYGTELQAGYLRVGPDDRVCNALAALSTVPDNSVALPQGMSNTAMADAMGRSEVCGPPPFTL